MRLRALLRRRSRGARWAPAAMMLAGQGCGSRSAVEVTPGPPPPPECTKDADCPGFDDLCEPAICQEETCQAGPVKDCDDHNPCTTDSCEPTTGICSHPRTTFDLDGDGYFAPLPGKRPTDPDSCGDDCDDANAAAHPGGVEVCDGADNDCNGVVDDGASLVLGGSATQISVATLAGPESLVGAGDGYMSAYSGEVAGHDSVYLAPISGAGARVGTPIRFSTVAADAFGGPLAWIGDRYGLAWSDRRDARGPVINYEIYFNLVNPDGTKRIADVRVTNATGFSISPALAWTGSQFVVLWQDDGMTALNRDFIFGQRIDVNGALVGGNVSLDNDGSGQLTPSVAAGKRATGVAWVRGTDPLDHRITFAPFDENLRPMRAPVELSPPMTRPIRPTIAFNDGQFVIAWHDQDSPVKAIYATVRDELGEEVVPVQAIVQSAAGPRYPSILPFGDRMLLVFSDLRNGMSNRELYARMLDPRLGTLQPDVRLTNTPGDSLDPIAAFGPHGDAGILFTDEDASGSPQVFFTRLACVTNAR